MFDASLLQLPNLQTTTIGCCFWKLPVVAWCTVALPQWLHMLSMVEHLPGIPAVACPHPCVCVHVSVWRLYACVCRLDILQWLWTVQVHTLCLQVPVC